MFNKTIGDIYHLLRPITGSRRALLFRCCEGSNHCPDENLKEQFLRKKSSENLNFDTQVDYSGKVVFEGQCV